MNPLLIKALPYIGGAVMLGGVYFKGVGDGKLAERVDWQKAEIAAVEQRFQKQAELQAQVDAAGAALSVLTSENERLTQRATANVRNYYAANPATNRQCLDAGILRAIADSDKARHDTEAASASPR